MMSVSKASMGLKSPTMVDIDDERDKGADTSTEAVQLRLPWDLKVRRAGTFTSLPIRENGCHGQHDRERICSLH